MQIVLLSGGSGKRLWPISNDTRSKQFLKLLKREDGTYESMVQRVYRQIQESGIDAHVTIATSISQVDLIKSQLGTNVDIVTEPERRDTFPAIALSSTYLRKQKKCSDDDVVVVMPVDQYTEEKYFLTTKQMAQAVEIGASDLVLMGVKPISPSSKFGYIIPNDSLGKNIVTVKAFKEKPSTEEAIKLISEGAYWNGGVFAFRLGYLMNIVSQYIEVKDFDYVRNSYSKLPKISFDYEVVEKAKSISMVPYSGIWEDLGTWNTLTGKMKDQILGHAVLNEKAKNVNIINELDIPIVVLGVNDVIVSASPDGILVCDKESSSQLKTYVEDLRQRPMYEERRWGTYRVLEHTKLPDETNFLTKDLFLNPGCSISYQRHKLRNEIWTFVDGEGDLVIDGHRTKVHCGDVVSIKVGQMHAIKAISQLRFVEVQLGSKLVEEDIERFNYEW